MKFLERFYYLIPAVFLFVIYNLTLGPSVVQIDAGELSAVQYTLGIAHPTGYPLFTILGYLFLHLPLWGSKIYQANFLAAIYCSTSTIFIVKFFFELLTLIDDEFLRRKTHKFILAIISALVLGLGTTFWFQSTSVEVYSLHLLLISITLFSLVKAYKSYGMRLWFLFAYLFGLALSNHMTSILIIPAAIYLYFVKFKFSKNSVLFGITLSLITLFSAAIVYLYLPVRAMQSPILNWGNPIDFERFWRHFTGAQYQVWIFSSIAASKKQLAYFFQILPNEFFYPSLFMILIGIFSLYKKSKIVFVFTLLLFFSTLLYSINYDIVDIDSYFLLAYISLAIFLMFGILRFIYALKTEKTKNYLLIGSLILLPSIQLLINFNKVNQSDNYIFEDYTKASLNSLPENSILFSYQWDYLISPSYYFQFVESFRNDITVIDKELLRRSWYYDQLNNIDPNLLNGLSFEVSSFLEALKPFETGGNFNPQILEKYYRLILQKLISENADRDFFIGIELYSNEMRNGEFSLPNEYQLIPYLLSFKVTKTKDYVEAPLPDFKFRIPKINNNYSEFIISTVCGMLQYRALYELEFGRIKRARIYSERIKEISPNYILNQNLMKILN